jgi:hypothetical protein
MTRANADNPDLSIGVTGFKAIACSNFAPIDFKISGFDVDRYNLAVVLCFDLRTHLSLVDFVTTPSKFFFAVSGLSYCHN